MTRQENFISTKLIGVRCIRHGRRFTEAESEVFVSLYAEPNCLACLDDFEGTPQEAVDYYAQYIRSADPVGWAADKVSILWGAWLATPQDPYGNSYYYAPYREVNARHNVCDQWSFAEAKTKEPLDWYALPVHYRRFPAFDQGLKWRPSPFQLYAPLRSVLTNRTYSGERQEWSDGTFEPLPEAWNDRR